MKAIRKSFDKNRKSYLYALKGIRETSKGNNFRYQLAAAVMVIALGIYTGLKPWEWTALLIMIGLVLAAEAFNTALEELVNLVSPNKNVLAGKIKDISAGAVLILALTSVAVALLIFLSKYIHF